MTGMERILTTASHREPDRVPLLLFPTLHGARELGLTIENYFSKAEHVVQGQLRMLERYGHDCVNGYFHVALEAEAWGGCTIFREDGPPNAGPPPLTADAIATLEPPRIGDQPGLRRVLEAQQALRRAVGDAVPVLGAVISPFSLPVLQLGFERYLDLIFDRPELMQRLMEVNAAFCVQWANAQVAAGAHAVSYIDPLASPLMIDPALYRRFGAPVAKKVIAAIAAPSAVHLASGPCLAVLEDLVDTGAVMVGAGEEDLATVKDACRGRITVVGNLNGIRMRSWDEAATLAAVRGAIDAAGCGGGFILSDQHGEIPWQVPETTLTVIADAVREYGRYPLPGGRG
ncbi:uroporphyrinogen decarboxylase family protein [Geomonas paludis]|uniref:Uroporphyrinogen decarboxylase family protein n=1 Tax=Geomonas paludis TaxID=2740185 RepID=A0A6V8MQ48_9BACT|nr:uroporphyrinogen decarboxylase family protein [Geomonas paludis]UPU36200.1 uroporphyrinogen decarboxylase family protein [Geomonas paludis]GFO62188.1 hypothetical protein GMPD_01070 [Geomonas paludis]